LFGLTTVRVGILLAAGTVVGLISNFTLPVLAIVMVVLEGIAFAWMGYAMWLGKRAVAAGVN
jgi:hypothetical protein